MSEVEVLNLITLRIDMNWSIIQWWIGITFTLVIASYVGMEHLTKILTSVAIILYTFCTLIFAQSVLNNIDQIISGFATLDLLSKSTDLSPMGQAALDEYRNPELPLVPIFLVCCFVAANGFVLYCRSIKIRLEKRGPIGT